MPKTQLHWQPGFTLSRKPAKKSTARRNKQGPPREGTAPQQYEFVCEYQFPAPTSHAPKRSKRTTAFTAPDDPDASAAVSQVTIPGSQSSPGSDGVPEIILVSDPSRALECDSSGDRGTASELAYLDAPRNGQHAPTAASIQTADTRPRLGAAQDSACPGSHDYTLTPSSIMYNSLFHRYEPILDRCTISCTLFFWWLLHVC